MKRLHVLAALAALVVVVHASSHQSAAGGLVDALTDQHMSCRRCYGSGCGVCGQEVSPAHPSCNFHGTWYRTQYYHDTCGGCSQNSGPGVCECYEGYMNGQSGGWCSDCAAGFVPEDGACVLPSPSPAPSPSSLCPPCFGAGCGVCSQQLQSGAALCQGHGTSVVDVYFSDACGRCDGGNKSPERCSCNLGFAGLTCDHCGVGYEAYPSCTPVSDTDTTTNINTNTNVNIGDNANSNNGDGNDNSGGGGGGGGGGDNTVWIVVGVVAAVVVVGASSYMAAKEKRNAPVSPEAFNPLRRSSVYADHRPWHV